MTGRDPSRAAHTIALRDVSLSKATATACFWSRGPWLEELVVWICSLAILITLIHSLLNCSSFLGSAVSQLPSAPGECVPGIPQRPAAVPCCSAPQQQGVWSTLWWCSPEAMLYPMRSEMCFPPVPYFLSVCQHAMSLPLCFVATPSVSN